MELSVLGEIINIEVIASGTSVQVRKRLNKRHGAAFWRKLKGQAIVRLLNGRVVLAELHWYEAHGLGRREIKVKRVLEVLDE